MGKAQKKLIQYLRVGIKKNHWYKVLNHEYFDEIGLRFNILDKAIYTENKLKSLEEVESIKHIWEILLKVLSLM